MAGGREQLVRRLTVSSCWKVCFGVSAARGTGSGGDKFGQRRGLPANFEMIIQVRRSETIFVPFSPPHRGCGVRTNTGLRCLCTYSCARAHIVQNRHQSLAPRSGDRAELSVPLSAVQHALSCPSFSSRSLMGVEAERPLFFRPSTR